MNNSYFDIVFSLIGLTIYFIGIRKLLFNQIKSI